MLPPLTLRKDKPIRTLVAVHSESTFAIAIQHGSFSMGCCHRQKEKRLAQEKYRNVKGLGEADNEGDDLMSWVGKSRRLDDERAKAERQAKMLAQQVTIECKPAH